MTQGKVTSVGLVRETVPSKPEAYLYSLKALSINTAPIQPRAYLERRPNMLFTAKLIPLKASSIKASSRGQETDK